MKFIQFPKEKAEAVSLPPWAFQTEATGSSTSASEMEEKPMGKTHGM